MKGGREKKRGEGSIGEGCCLTAHAEGILEKIPEEEARQAVVVGRRFQKVEEICRRGILNFERLGSPVAPP